MNGILCKIVTIMAVFCSMAEIPCDLDSEAAYTRYLPRRLKELTSYAKQHGINAAVDMIAADDDLDSFLFQYDLNTPRFLNLGMKGHHLLELSKCVAFAERGLL